MKINLLVLSLLIVIRSTIAQNVVVVENFETWPPNGWSEYKLDIGGSWRHSLGPIGYIGYGAEVSISNDPCNNWLVSPKVLINGSNYHLNFWEEYGSTTFYNYSGVLVSTSSGDPNDGMFTQLYTTPDTSESWMEKTIDLSAYNGQEIYVAFQYIGTWHEWIVDEISITPDTFIDASISSILNPKGINTTTGNENILIRIVNKGTEIIDSAEINWYVDGATSGEQPTKRIKHSKRN